MRVEERRQCAHQDRFWGLDFLAYEQEREAWEVSTMRLLLMSHAHTALTMPASTPPNPPYVPQRSLMAEEEALVWALIRARRRDEEAEERRHAEALARLQVNDTATALAK